MIDFHTAPNEKKYEIAKHFKDDRYKEIAIRILYEIAPYTLPENDKRNYEFEIKERFLLPTNTADYWDEHFKANVSNSRDIKGLSIKEML